MLSIIIAFYGDDERRVDCTKQCITQLFKQTLPFEIIFVEMIEKKSLFSDFFRPFIDKIKHKIIQSTSNHKYLFQKESLYNIGAKLASFNNLIFMDSDIYSEDVNWLLSINNKINDDTMVQGFSVFQDTVDSELDKISFCSSLNDGIDNYIGCNTGLCWGMTKKTFNELNGLNNKFFIGSGDVAVIHECSDPTTSPVKKYMSQPYMYQLLRDTNVRKYFDNTHHIIKHIYHGSLTSRKYTTRHIAIGYLLKITGTKVKDYIDFGELLTWKSDDSALKFLAMNKTALPDDHDELIDFVKFIVKKYNKDKTFNVFNPTIIKDTYNPSWGSNIENIQYNKLPLDGNKIICRAVDVTKPMIAGLCVSQTWSNVNLSKYTYGQLSFEITGKYSKLEIFFQNADKVISNKISHKSPINMTEFISPEFDLSQIGFLQFHITSTETCYISNVKLSSC